MRPHTLRVTAFGAFGGTVSVNFDDLAQAGLFLLHGETGAGKTTLLDAIGFALYGRVPGVRGDAKRLRSDHADLGTATEVELEATIGGRRMRITRRPEQPRPKRRGDGFTTEQARVLLAEQRGSAWETLSTRVGEADAEIADLMGMSAEQFFQVVLLPQGQFAQFLHANADKRGELLQRLFGTDRFRAVEKWLADRRRAVTHEVDDASARLGQLAARIAEAAGVAESGGVGEADGVAASGSGTDADGVVDAGGVAGEGAGVPGAAGVAVPADLSPADLAAWADELTMGAAADEAVAAGAAQIARERLDAEQARAREAESLAGRQRRRAAALHRRAELTEAEPGIAALAAELAAAQRAAEVAPALDTADEADAALTRARTAEEKARAAVGLVIASPAGTSTAANAGGAGTAGRADTAGGAGMAGGALTTGGAVADSAGMPGGAVAGSAFTAGGAVTGGAGMAGGAAAGQIADGAAGEAGAGGAATAAGMRAAAREWQQRVGQLDALRALAEQADAEDTLAGMARAAADRMAAEAAECEQRIAADLQRREEAVAARDAAASAANALPDARAEADRHRRAADDAAALVTARTDAERERQAHLTAREQAVGLHEQANRLRDARIDGMRAELAATLVDGAPCPVCGSLDHPELCELRGERVTREQEEEATAAAEAADRAAEVVGAKVASAQTLAGTLTARLGASGFAAVADLDLADLRTEAKRLDAMARDLDEHARTLAATAAKLSGRQDAFDSLGRAIADAETRLAELTQQRAAELNKAEAAAGRAAEQRQALRDQLGGAPDLESALRAARIAAETLTVAADAVDAAARAVEAAAKARETAGRASADAGFAGPEDARAAQREHGWRTASDRAIREHEAATAAVAEQLADPELDVALEPAADVSGASAAVDEASKANTIAVAALARAQRRAEQLAGLRPGLDAQLAEFGPLLARSAEIHRLADLANGLGANTLKMTLSSFVLAARLEEVASAASQRLLRMTAGRYSLVHTDSRRGGGRAGLGLLACDAWTGSDRDTSTLSGGETFMASLALALGLADVVTEEAGGARIEALFVDEGFGSLDEETLEEVMNVLDGLREGGRCVGIVSHVSELRQRIPAQIRVRKGHSGSTISVRAETV